MTDPQWYDTDDEYIAAREASEYPTSEQLEEMAAYDRAQYEALCAEHGVKPDHDDDCDDDNPCGECRADAEAERYEERRYERRR